MILALGIIIGLLLAIIWLLVSVKILPEPSKFIATIERSAKSRQKGEVIFPKDEVTEAREKMIREKHDAGLDVFLEDL